ncbi:MAG: DNA adenine methylase [Bacilli bacterium]
MKPILKWVGGKKQLLPHIQKKLPNNFKTYYEVFFGGGAVFFHIKPKKAVINDFNSELINLYKVIKANPQELIDDLKTHVNEADYFYKIRSYDRDPIFYNKLTSVKKASRILYLNKTCYNGLYRVNSQGQLNAPFGRYVNPKICDEENILDISSFLNNNDIEILDLDFEKSLNNASEGDFVYLDPPYDPLTDTAAFTGYNAGGFGKPDQIRLRNICNELNEKGVKFLLSNSDTKFIRELYSDYNIDVVFARRSINSKGEKRGEIPELLISNYNE